MNETQAKPSGLAIDWLRTFAGALAAVTSAVLLSTLGAAGTIIGAALGSIAATVGTTLYASALAKSKDSVTRAQKVTSGKVEVARTEIRRASRSGRQAEGDEAVDAHLEMADEQLAEVGAELDEPVEPPLSLGGRLSGLPWKRIAISTLAMFVVVLLAITAFELLTGRSVASRTGGSDGGRTTIGSVTNEGKDEKKDQKKDQEEDEQQPSDPAVSLDPTDQASPSTEPTEAPVETPAPLDPPTDNPAPTEPAPVPPAPAEEATP